MPAIPHDADRCIHRTSDGRRCREWRTGNGCFLCYTHRKIEERDELRRAEALAAANSDATPPLLKFENVYPNSTEDLLRALREAPVENVAAVSAMLDRVLALHMSNDMSARSLSAVVSLLRLRLKTIPLLRQERDRERHRADTERFAAQLAEILKDARRLQARLPADPAAGETGMPEEPQVSAETSSPAEAASQDERQPAVVKS